MKIWNLYIFNLWIDVKRFGKKLQRNWNQFKQNYYGWIMKKMQRNWNQFKQNYYGWIMKKMQRKQRKYNKKLLRIHTNFYECGGEYISAKVNDGFHERTDVIIKMSKVRL